VSVQRNYPDLLTISKIPSLDGLRAISIFFVLVSHIFYNSENEDLKILGRVGVEIFFVISGFLITTLLLKEKVLTSKINLKKFYIRRAFRILPVVLLYLLVLSFLNGLFDLGISNRSFVAAIFFVKNLPIPNTGDWYTGHLWSLAIEEQFYLLFPFLIMRLTIPAYKYFVLALVCVLPIINFLYYQEVGPFYSNRSVHLIAMIIVNLFSMGTVSILIGSLTAVLVFDHEYLLTRISGLNFFYFSSVLFIVALILRMPWFNLYIPYFSQALFACIIGVVIILNLNINCLMAKLLNRRWMMKIGVLSYSLYIWQQLFLHKQPWSGAFKHADSTILNLIILLLVTYVSYHFYEKKFLVLRDRFKTIK